jgi:heme A synthase
MKKGVVVPLVLFFFSLFLSVVSLYFLFGSLILGLALCVAAMLQSKRSKATSEVAEADNTLLRSGAVLTIAPIVTGALVAAGMAGLFK